MIPANILLIEDNQGYICLPKETLIKSEFKKDVQHVNDTKKGFYMSKNYFISKSVNVYNFSRALTFTKDFRFYTLQLPVTK